MLLEGVLVVVAREGDITRILQTTPDQEVMVIFSVVHDRKMSWKHAWICYSRGYLLSSAQHFPSVVSWKGFYILGVFFWVKSHWDLLVCFASIVQLVPFEWFLCCHSGGKFCYLYWPHFGLWMLFLMRKCVWKGKKGLCRLWWLSCHDAVCSLPLLRLILIVTRKSFCSIFNLVRALI